MEGSSKKRKRSKQQRSRTNTKNSDSSFQKKQKKAETTGFLEKTSLDSSSVDIGVFAFPSWESTTRPSSRKLTGFSSQGSIQTLEAPSFINAICELGFKIELKDYSNKMFVLLHFKKKKAKPSSACLLLQDGLAIDRNGEWLASDSRSEKQARSKH